MLLILLTLKIDSYWLSYCNLNIQTSIFLRQIYGKCSYHSEKNNIFGEAWSSKKKLHQKWFRNRVEYLHFRMTHSHLRPNDTPNNGTLRLQIQFDI